MAEFKNLFLVIAYFTYKIEAVNVQEMEMHPAAPLKLKNFSWKSCSKDPNPVIDFKALSISEDPIKGGGEATLSFTADVKMILSEGQRLSANITVESYEGGGQYTNLCPLFEDYCHRDDLCNDLQNYIGKAYCPDFLKNLGFTCTCPIKAKEYKITNQPITIPAIPVTGSFNVTIDVFAKDKPAGCLNMMFCLNECATD